VQRPERVEGLEHHQVQRALQHLRAVLCHDHRCNVARFLCYGHRAAAALTPTIAPTSRILDLLAEDNRLNVYAGELELRPPGAPTTSRRIPVNAGSLRLV
jgi:hypothetical protein